MNQVKKKPAGSACGISVETCLFVGLEEKDSGGAGGNAAVQQDEALTANWK